MSLRETEIEAGREEMQSVLSILLLTEADVQFSLFKAGAVWLLMPSALPPSYLDRSVQSSCSLISSY